MAELPWESARNRRPTRRSKKSCGIKLRPGRVYPFDIPSIASLKSLVLDRGVTYLVGENGGGQVHLA